jgi:hypothetical protein
MKFEILEFESGETETVEASDLEEAKTRAQEWLDGGNWGDVEEYVEVKITDEAGTETTVELVVGAAPVPDCRKGSDHTWESPFELLGGLEENPGVWGLQGTQLKIIEVCCQCGCYRQTITKSTPDNYPREPERVTYRKPDKKSLAWVGSDGDNEEE